MLHQFLDPTTGRSIETGGIDLSPPPEAALSAQPSPKGIGLGDIASLANPAALALNIGGRLLSAFIDRKRAKRREQEIRRASATQRLAEAVAGTVPSAPVVPPPRGPGFGAAIRDIGGVLQQAQRQEFAQQTARQQLQIQASEAERRVQSEKARREESARAARLAQTRETRLAEAQRVDIDLAKQANERAAEKAKRSPFASAEAEIKFTRDFQLKSARSDLKTNPNFVFVDVSQEPGILKLRRVDPTLVVGGVKVGEQRLTELLTIEGGRIVDITAEDGAAPQPLPTAPPEPISREQAGISDIFFPEPPETTRIGPGGVPTPAFQERLRQTEEIRLGDVFQRTGVQPQTENELNQILQNILSAGQELPTVVGVGPLSIGRFPGSTTR